MRSVDVIVGSTIAHSASVQSLAYRTPQRAYCCRVVLVQAIRVSVDSQPTANTTR
jgi:hypothetical protein